MRADWGINYEYELCSLLKKASTQWCLETFVKESTEKGTKS